MVVCKFFLQGTCKFGDSCKFEHQLNDHNYGASSILLQNYAPKPQATSTVDTNTLVKAVVNDMTTAEKGGQWLLSSYAPFKEKPAFPGFEDHSMEEVRYLFYESVKNGTIEQFKQTLQTMFQQAMMKIKALQNPSPDVVSILKTIYDTPPSNTNSGNPPTNSIFGGAQAQKPIFANTPSSTFTGGTNTNSIFGATNPASGTSIFGNPASQSKSIFGQPQAAATAPTSSMFPQQPLFAKQPTSQQTPFAPAQNVFQQNSPFQAQNQNSSPFQTTQNQTNNPFQTPLQNQNSGPFQAPVQNQNSNPFQAPPQNQSSGPFQAPPQNQGNSPFQAPPPNTFPAPAQNQPFAPSQTKPAFQHTQSIFGNLVQPGNNVFVAPTKPTQEFYSKLEDLTEEEIKWFQSDDLDIMKIPDKPPTFEMCFKVQ